MIILIPSFINEVFGNSKGIDLVENNNLIIEKLPNQVSII